MPPERRTVEVWADWEGVEPSRAGFLRATAARGKEVFSFEYDRSWLEGANALALDPSLHLYRGAQHLPIDRSNFGVFLDSSPDRWGRTLMLRREAQLARAEDRAVRRLSELDFLLGVYDGHRMGGLRYRVDDGPFLDDNTELASPPWTSLRELEQASLHLERDDAEDDPRFGQWLRMLMAPGHSLGGARPKASVLDEHQQLWIAKFPSERDDADIGAWESILHTLAGRAGITTSTAAARRFASRHHTFLTKRFDRSHTGRRIHFASAMTMLERQDNESGASYLDLAEVLVQHGANPTRDLEQLWRRVVFNICVSNVDDHLRNHGFLLEPRGWSLAPAYDMNPVAYGDGLTLNISESDNAQELGLARDVAKQFRINASAAEVVIHDIIAVVRTWRTEAMDLGLSRRAQDEMAPAFRVADGT